MRYYKFGDIVLLKLPFTDGETFRKRPALVISETNDADMIVCRITSRIYRTGFDIEINEWKECGLKLQDLSYHPVRGFLDPDRVVSIHAT